MFCFIMFWTKGLCLPTIIAMLCSLDCLYRCSCVFFLDLTSRLYAFSLFFLLLVYYYEEPWVYGPAASADIAASFCCIETWHRLLAYFPKKSVPRFALVSVLVWTKRWCLPTVTAILCSLDYLSTLQLRFFLGLLLWVTVFHGLPAGAVSLPGRLHI